MSYSISIQKRENISYLLIPAVFTTIFWNPRIRKSIKEFYFHTRLIINTRFAFFAKTENVLLLREIFSYTYFYTYSHTFLIHKK